MPPSKRKFTRWYLLSLALLCVFLVRYISGGHEKAEPKHLEPIVKGEWYRPVAGIKWQIQLQGDVNTQYDAELYDIDLFDSSPALIKKLHDSGRHVICYFSAGSSEEWREDYKRFEDSDKGNPLQGWPGEKWLNIRSQNVRDIMKMRMDLAREKGCDGVDPDNVDGYNNNSGFNITSDDQLEYNKLLANEAHIRGLAISLKNDLDQVDELSEVADFSINEQCFQYDECEKLGPFIAKNKPVLNIEYNKDMKPEDLCRKSRFMKFSTLIMPLKLDNSERTSCLDLAPAQ